MKKTIFWLIVAIIIAIPHAVKGVPLAAFQGGTGIDSTTSTDAGKALMVSTTGSGPNFKWYLGSLPSGSATPTFYAVTTAGNTTTNQIQFAGGTSTAAFTIQGLLTAPTGSFTYTDATTTNATFAAIGTLTGSNATITNVSSTNMSVSSSLLVAGKAVCLADGTNCLPTSTPTLQQVATAGNTTSLALIFAGGTSTANFVVTGTLNAQTTTLGQTAITNGLSVVGNATISGNATSTNFFATGLSGTNLTYTSATGTNHTITTLTGTNATITSVTSTNLFSTTGTFTNLVVTAAITGGSLAISGNATIGGTLGVTGDSTLATTTVTSLSVNGVSYPSAAGTAGQIFRSNGTNFVLSTSIWPDTTTANQILYSSSANTVAGITTANNGVLVTSAGGVPSIGSTLPTAVQGNITSVGTLTGLTVSGVTSLATTTMTAATSTSLVVTGAISGSTLSLSSTLNVSGVSTLATTTITQLTVSGNATTTGNQVISGTAKVTGATTLSGALTVSGLSSLASTTITGNATTTVNQVIGGTLSVAGASTLTGNITAAGTLTATSSVTNTLKIATNGFTKFGELAPNIKTAYFTGTTPDGSTGGGATTVTLTGINASKIISITVMFDFTGTGWWMMAGYGTSPGYKLDWYTDNDTSNTTLYLNTANLPDSINVGANDARIYVTYIE